MSLENYNKVRTVDVYATTDYDMFKKLEGNRDFEGKPSKVHIERLKKSMELNPELAEFLPIMVQRGTNKVLDGQHRLQARKELGLPVYFTYADDIGIEETHVINSNTRAWILEDYARSYAKLGKEHYVDLVKIMDRHKIPPSIALILTSGALHNSGKLNGGFKVGNYHPVFTPQQTAVLIGEFEELAELIPDIKRNSRVAAAWFNVRKAELYDHEMLVAKIRNKLAASPTPIKFTTNISENMRIWEQLFNWKTQTYRRLY